MFRSLFPPLTSFFVLLNDELSGKDDEFLEFKLTGLVLIDLLDQLIQSLLVELLTHQSEDLSDSLGGDVTFLLTIEGVEGILEDCGEKSV